MQHPEQNQQQQQRHHRLKSWPDNWSTEVPLSHVLLKMQLANHHHHLLNQQQSPNSSRSNSRSHSRSHSRSQSPCPPLSRDLTSHLPDSLLLSILSLLPSPDRDPTSLVCKRWLRLHGLLRRSLTLSSFSLTPSLIPSRYPNLTSINLIPASFSTSSPSPLLLNTSTLSIPITSNSLLPISNQIHIPPDTVDQSLEHIARGCPNLCKLSLAVTDNNSMGLLSIANHCSTLQELELHCCTDLTLRSISAFHNLQILKLVGSIEPLYSSPNVTDIGLTILAHGCKRLVKLELSGCEGSYDGISAVGRCCLMLEELTVVDHRMDAGWMAGLSFCGNLKTLRMVSCRRIDEDPGPAEHLGECGMMERVMLQKCQLRDKRSFKALFMMCGGVREIVFQNCWGLDDEMFGIAGICRNVRSLTLEGCSQLTTEGLESVILSWVDLKRLIVVSCNSVRDDAVSPDLSTLFSVLKEFKWRPDSKSVLAMNLAGTGMGRKGGRFFKRARGLAS